MRILAVSVLTSFDDKDLAKAGYRDDVRTTVLARARSAQDRGCDGLVCSGLEVEAIRRALAVRRIEFDEKPFRPHVTLGRVRDTASRDEARAISTAIDAATISSLRFGVASVHVIESHVSPKGPRYTSRANVPLTVGGKR